MIFHSFGSLSVTSAGGVSFAAASATLPYVVVRPEGLCVTTLLAALHSAAGTLQALAAACTSIMRAVAPPLRTYSFDSRMPRLPPVEKLPHTRLRATDWPGVGYSVVTFVQSASSSSATICARPVSVPCPISERATRTTTVSSGRMTTHAVISGEPSCARTTPAPNGIFKPRVSPAPTAAVPMTNARRSIFGVLMIMASPLCLRRGVNGLAHLLVRPAAADVGDPRVDVGIGRLRLVLEECRHCHDHPGLAVAALGHLEVDPCLLDLVQGGAARQTLDRGDLLALGRADRQHAGADRLAVEVHRAGSAHRDAAAVLGAGEAGLLADRPQKGCARIDLELEGFAVDGHARHSFFPPWIAVRCCEYPRSRLRRQVLSRAGAAARRRRPGSSPRRPRRPAVDRTRARRCWPCGRPTRARRSPRAASRPRRRPSARYPPRARVPPASRRCRAATWRGRRDRCCNPRRRKHNRPRRRRVPRPAA